ncbi:hypothetical protein [Kitasatospora phosalacinea]|uniref:hypothetical protein n=1 Tax=Kitasatospora phosalacinea TaxID=2065 RepID=UPI00052666CD|nr:hypothetical protein [Kitasatospora phosalacinea]
MSKQKTFAHPADLTTAQPALETARAARHALLAIAPRWTEPQTDTASKDSTVMAGSEGWNEEQAEDNRRLLEVEAQAARTVWAHPHRQELQGTDRVNAQTQLMHLNDQADQAA